MNNLTISEGVLKYLSQAIETTGGPGNNRACFRFNIGDDGDPQLSVDFPNQNDRTFQFGDRTVLVIASELSEKYRGRSLDINAAGDLVLS